MQRELQQELEREVTDEEVAERLSISLEDLHKTQSLVTTMNMLSLDALGATQDGDQLDIMQCLADRSGPDVLERLNLKETAAALGEAIDALPEKERLVLTLYYYEEMTMKEIGKTLGITESRVCQLHGKALIRLRNALEDFRSR